MSCCIRCTGVPSRLQLRKSMRLFLPTDYPSPHRSFRLLSSSADPHPPVPVPGGVPVRQPFPVPYLAVTCSPFHTLTLVAVFHYILPASTTADIPRRLPRPWPDLTSQCVCDNCAACLLPPASFGCGLSMRWWPEPNAQSLPAPEASHDVQLIHVCGADMHLSHPVMHADCIADHLLDGILADAAHQHLRESAARTVLSVDPNAPVHA